MLKPIEKRSPYATVKEASVYLRCSYSHAHKSLKTWNRKYGVRLSWTGKNWLMTYADLDNMVQQMEVAS